MCAPLPTLSRPQLCGRISSLRDALDTLASQSAVDGHGSFASVGPLKRELIALEARLRTLATVDELPVVCHTMAFGKNMAYLARKEG